MSRPPTTLLSNHGEGAYRAYVKFYIVFADNAAAAFSTDPNLSLYLSLNSIKVLFFINPIHGIIEVIITGTCGLSYMPVKTLY